MHKKGGLVFSVFSRYCMSPTAPIQTCFGTIGASSLTNLRRDSDISRYLCLISLFFKQSGCTVRGSNRDCACLILHRALTFNSCFVQRLPRCSVGRPCGVCQAQPRVLLFCVGLNPQSRGTSSTSYRQDSLTPLPSAIFFCIERTSFANQGGATALALWPLGEVGGLCSLGE